jgi:predicted nucleotidyltransferase
MDRDRAIETLRAHEADLHRAGVARLYLFGSVARREARPDSDVDLFFDTDNPRFSLIELVDVQQQVSDILGTETDVMTRASLHPMLRSQIEAEALRVF